MMELIIDKVLRVSFSLDRIVCDDAVRNREIQDLLTEALAKAHE